MNKRERGLLRQLLESEGWKLVEAHLGEVIVLRTGTLYNEADYAQVRFEQGYIRALQDIVGRLKNLSREEGGAV